MVDNDLPPNLARALHLIFELDGDEVVALRDKFGRQNLTDSEWITALGREGDWAVLSADMRIAKHRPSRDAFVAAGLVGLFFPPSLQKATLAKQTARLLTLWPDIREQVRLNANGCFEMPAKGSKFRQIGR
jgi:hypothetical protein